MQDSKLNIEGFKLEKLTIPGNSDPKPGIKISTLKYTNNKQFENGYNIFAAHPNGLSKESFVPFLRKLLAYLKQSNFENINAIVSVDMRNQGDSAELNKGLLDGPFLWSNYALDNYEVIKFLHLDSRKLIGIGNSIGAVSLLAIESMFKPKTFVNIVAYEPSLYCRPVSEFQMNLFEGTKRKRGTWESREQARKHFERKAFYKAWDKEVFELFMEFGLIDLPEGGVGFKCTPLQEYKTFVDDHLFQPKMFANLNKVECPVLFGHGGGPTSYLHR
ncbi:hypothetical protein K502DRAFT_324502 [Neoconidiobolus thromboides FSU 785]|nr:hypothetical protein K502DRAFT_324502 [Neoconidiobolus thromboides FSU 785]